MINMCQTALREWAIELVGYEKELFLWLNSLHASWLDQFMYLYSDMWMWFPLMLTALLVHTVRVPWREALTAVVAIALVFTLCDQISSSWLKPFFARPRPTHFPEIEHLVHTVNGYRGGKYGFVSGHSANSFGIAVFVSLVFRYRIFSIVMLSWATLTAYSRIYLGVHFITDIIGGILVGIVVGIFVYYSYIFARKCILGHTWSDALKSPLSHQRAHIVMSVIGVEIVAMLFMGFFC